MAFKNFQENNNNRKKKIVERFRNRIPLPSMQDQKQRDTLIIDAALRAMYNEGDKVPRALQDDILAPNNIRLSEKDAARIWDIMINTGLAHALIGFGNAGKLDLTSEGYQLMNQFGSYSAFLQEKERQAQGQHMAFPQFIIEQAGEEKDEKEEGKEQKAVGKREGHEGQ